MSHILTETGSSFYISLYRKRQNNTIQKTFVVRSTQKNEGADR